MLAEDDSDDRLLFREAVSRASRKTLIQEAIDGEVALEMLTKSETIPDIVVLDINMPRLNGLDCLNMIRKNPRFIDIPVIILSTSRNKKDISDAQSAGATFYAIKPGSFKKLQDMLETLIGIEWSSFQSDPDQFLLNSLVE